MTLKINPFAKNPNDRMSWKDAAIVSLILTIANFFMAFLTQWTYETIIADPGNWLFTVIKFLGGNFFANFLALSGLAKLIARKEG